MSVYNLPQALDAEVKVALKKMDALAQRSSGGSLCAYGTGQKAKEHLVAIAVQRHLNDLKRNGYQLK